MATPLGDRLRELRKKKGFTLDELAEGSKSSKSYIWVLENKDPPRPSGEKLALIAEALGVTTDYLLGVEVEVENAQDKAFFRKYQQLDALAKSQLREMLDIIARRCGRAAVGMKKLDSQPNYTRRQRTSMSEALEMFRALRSDIEQFDDHPPDGSGDLFSERVPRPMKSYIINWLRRYMREHGDEVEAALASTANEPQRN